MLHMSIRLFNWTRQRIPSYTSQYRWSLTPHQIPLSMYQGLHILHNTSSVLIIHQSKGNCELQIQTFREFSTQTSYSQK
ncbi:hypothetical protein NC653_035286 [Populus alba x Populus x berolinensis]|uniref:Uncharacterized protein n=1 Tax=Populus alba x Populus x berolinensis TaxID=444605 RepID=A0AAD6LPL3_9ROSI|nr:hypothetical protein NC653_035286 [Populus alba x Populus x berolinensis]